MANITKDKFKTSPREGGGDKEDRYKTGTTRPESDVFESPQGSVDPDTGGYLEPGRGQLDSGYLTGTSVGTSVSSFMAGTDTNVDTDSDTGAATAMFYMTQDSLEDDFPQIPIDDDDEDEEDSNHHSGASVETMRAVTSPETSPMAIPSASSHHDVHHMALGMMDATPPRSYTLQNAIPGTAQGSIHSTMTGHHFSTGCLSQSHHIAQMLLTRRGSRCSELVETGLRVASGRLNVSRSKAAVHRQRSTSESECPNEFIRHRDRSQSAPDIGDARRKILQKQCAAELRKISDEFFEDFPRMKAKVSRGQPAPVPMTTHARSYPGTSRSRQKTTWWQTIIQNLSPARARPSTDDVREVASEQEDTESSSDTR